MFRFQSRKLNRLYSVALVLLGAALAWTPNLINTVQSANASSANAPEETITFNLHPVPAMLNCFAAHPTNPNKKPTALVTVKRGSLNDKLTMTLSNFKPNLDFDMFTVQNSNLDSNGNPVGGFGGFGLAWYQSDVHVESDGTGLVKIKTILLDQIFGFDGSNPTPTHTFHVGMWFNDPNVPFNGGCETGQMSPIITPFNGEQHAGPDAMITIPDATFHLGPLCTSPASLNTCNP